MTITQLLNKESSAACRLAVLLDAADDEGRVDLPGPVANALVDYRDARRAVDEAWPGLRAKL
jgi:hypothetical protein